MDPIVRPATEADLPGILTIYNEVIANTTSVYHYQPHSQEMRHEWFMERKAGGWPVIVAEVDGMVAGFGAIGPFRFPPAYRYTAEHTLHVHADHRGAGIGRTLLQALITEALRLELHALIGGIDADNSVSIRLHAGLGFTECAHIRQVGYKFGRWLDLKFMQLLLPGPATPVEQ